VRVWLHPNRTVQTSKAHGQHHSHSMHMVSIGRSVAKVSMYKASVQTAIVSRSTSKRSTFPSQDSRLNSACRCQEFLAWDSRSLCRVWHNKHVSLVQRSQPTARQRLIERGRMLQK
jgi:hypothetical protein